MTLAYKVEELLALRDSVSESAVSIDKFADEDVIKEHVLRPSASASANLPGRASSNSLRPTAPPAPGVASAAAPKKPSPSPSIKRGKAEKLLKEHGSPPGMRVTAGGRVVPSDLLPLGTSRFLDTAYRQQTLRATSGNTMVTEEQSHANCNARIEVVSGQPVVIVGDRIYALPAVSTSTTTTALGSRNPIDSIPKQIPDSTGLSTDFSTHGMMLGTQRTQNQPVLAGLDIGTLKSQQTLKRQELRTVEQAEVLQSSHQSEAWRVGMIERKRNLIVELDSLRKHIAALENDSVTSAPTTSFLGPMNTVPGPSPSPSFVPQVARQLPQAIYTFPATNPYAPLMMYQPPYETFAEYPVAEPASFTTGSIKPPHSPESAGRRSHAIEIKPPPEETKKQPLSALDPKSPTYEPAVKSECGRSIAPRNSFPSQRSPWRYQGELPSDRPDPRAPSHKPSLSSIDTTDFFPTNTHEHSSTRLAPQTNDYKQPANEHTVVPSTPERHWPASPWNDAGSSRSRQDDPTSRTWWPEAFGKQRSSSSLRQNGTTQPSPAPLSRAPMLDAFAQDSVGIDTTGVQTGSNQHNASDRNWPLSRKMVTHVPSTYQEGYQAGYDHIDMPDNPEVLQGYIQGLLQFLGDESKKGSVDGVARELYVRRVGAHTPSLRGLIAGSTAHESAVSMASNGNNRGSGGQENVRSSKTTLTAEMFRDSAYSPRGSALEVPISQALPIAPSYGSRSRNVSNMIQPSSVGLFPERPTSGRQTAFPLGETDQDMTIQDKSVASRAEAPLSVGGFRQFSGTQLQNRINGTPLSMQRFQTIPQKARHVDSARDDALIYRPHTNHRLSGLDGAMDDLAEMTTETQFEGNRMSSSSRSAEAPIPVEAEEVSASCFKASGNKGKQRPGESPKRSTSERIEKMVSSPVNTASSPKKSGEHSPTKIKLEQVTNKFRRSKRDDPRTMSPEDKAKRSDKWRQRFQHLKRTELEEIEEHRKNTRN